MGPRTKHQGGEPSKGIDCSAARGQAILGDSQRRMQHANQGNYTLYASKKRNNYLPIVLCHIRE